MAFNYYQPTTYPIGYNSSPVGYNSSPTYSNSNTGMVWVNDYNEAVMYPVAPNAAVALWDKTNPSIYLKRADSTGKPSIQIYDLVERKEMPKEKTQDFVLKTDLDAVKATVEELRKNLDEIKLNINISEAKDV